MDVLISGASVAGPVLAYWLRRRGFFPVVVERTPRPRLGLGGHAVDLFEPAMEVASRMGLVSALREARTESELLVLERPGRPAAELRLNAVVPAFDDDKHVEILRGELATILHGVTRDDVEYRFGDSIRTLAEDATGVDVTFESGETRRFDLVVGADGLHSRVRELVFGPESEFRHDLGGYFAVFSLPNYRRLVGKIVLHLDVNRMAAVYPVRQTKDARAVLMFRSDTTSQPDHRDVAAQRELVRKTYAGQEWELPRLLAAMDDADDFYLDTISQIRMPSWSRGRVVLVGDAGYSPGPAVGGGTTLAMVAAYVLAHALEEADGDHANAFAVYESRIRDYVRLCRDAAPRVLRNGVPRNRVHRAIAETSLRLLPRLPDRVRSRILAGGISGALSSFALPE
ncbi:MAG: FAD-dependent monooxygenase [Saccharomonospora viridis]|jgi:2-polyprenyl-6-methoxyphenol hydroxylase-like FAD-dependent oxidoreductase|uniref:2-polyprenyl-6-methoxyphenol hydroxylase n=1 Tax=Saccharomonospora viridis TaxID=1852 RepID=A0A837D8U7_9PSEU|nr:FAD-dependent monooxygenase [Saccharomonospora viridis]KHF42206.1 2-polyprenyl-6-methoxyphenol hydroxylase [Saccharomonospora viridis]SFP46619.1 2-polyprenyl-6-methoxyphenol hydroxylase [Saccharomonospora viridis]